MTTPPGQGEIPPLTAKDLDHLEGDPGRPRASRCRSVTFHWSAAEWGSLIAIARLGLEAQRWKAAAELATAGERGRAQELAAARRDLDEVLRMRADVVDRLTAYQVGVAAIVADDGLTSGAVRGRLSELLGARMAPIAGPHFDVVFDGPPGPEAGRFVEVEDDQGRGISIGHWVPPAKGAEHYPMQPPKVDQFWRLRITRAEVLARMPAPAEPATSDARVPHDSAGGWAEVTRQLGERVAKLEAVSKLAERQVDPVLAAMETVMLDPEPEPDQAPRAEETARIKADAQAVFEAQRTDLATAINLPTTATWNELCQYSGQLRAMLRDVDRALDLAPPLGGATRADRVRDLLASLVKQRGEIQNAARQLSSAVGDGRPCSLTEAVDRVQHVLDKTRANLGPRQDGETLQAQAGRVAVELAEAESQLANERAAALEQAKVKGRRAADLERAALVAKLQLVREVCGVNASLDAPGGDNVVERVRALADQLGQVCEAVKTEDAAHVVDEVRALVESEAKWEAEAQKLQAKLDDIKAKPSQFLQDIGYLKSIPVSADPGIFTAWPQDPIAAEYAKIKIEEREARIASGLYPVPGIPSRRPLTLAAEQILRDVIEAANASGFTKLCDVFEVRHRPADAETPPRTELHVFAGKGPTTATTQVLAYVELGELWIIGLNGLSGYVRSTNARDGYRWPERIRAALDRK